MEKTPPFFDHEKLFVYKRSIEFVAWVTDLLENLPAKRAVAEQLDRASTSIPLNIAEGNGKYTPPDRCRYIENARGSALESAACLDVLVAKRLCTPEEIRHGKVLLHEIVAMLMGLIRKLSPDRLIHESDGEEPSDTAGAPERESKVYHARDANPP